MERYYFSIASGSSGNCGLYVCGGTAILIDLGVSVRRLRQSLAVVGLDIPDLSGVLITHEHVDHVKGLNTFAKNYAVPLYATTGTVEALCEKTPQATKSLHAFRGWDCFTVGTLSVQSFLTPHDAAESAGYVITHRDTAFGFCTDLGFIPTPAQKMLFGCDTVVLESNHDLNMLDTGPYPYYLKERVRGTQGHLSNPDCAVMAAALVRQGTRTLVLAHLSDKNNTPLTALRETRCALDAAGLACSVLVAPRDAMEAPIELKGSYKNYGTTSAPKLNAHFPAQKSFHK